MNALPLADGALAGYRADLLYQHLADPESALAEARRVLAPGGHLVLVDQDWDAFVIDGKQKDVTRAALLGFSDSTRNGWIGRSYHRLLTGSGFDDVTVHPEAVTVTDPELGSLLSKLVAEAAVETGGLEAAAAEQWLADQRTRLETETFFAAMTHSSRLAVGRNSHRSGGRKRSHAGDVAYPLLEKTGTADNYHLFVC